MTRLVKKGESLFPTILNDLLDTPSFFPDVFKTNWDFAVKVPSANITESDKDYKVEVAAPGLEKKNFKIELENKVLTISAEKEEEKKEDNKNFKRREFSYNSFSRSFQLPEDVLSDKIDAKYENGILALVIPKKEVTVTKPKKEIKVS